MLSRYTAFVIGDLDHIENSHACDKREGLDRPDVKNMFGAVEWDGLEIFRTSVGLQDIGRIKGRRGGDGVFFSKLPAKWKNSSPLGKLEFSPR